MVGKKKRKFSREEEVLQYVRLNRVRDTITGVRGVIQALGLRSRQFQAVRSVIGRYWREQARSSASSPGPPSALSSSSASTSPPVPQSPTPEPPSAPTSASGFRMGGKKKRKFLREKEVLQYDRLNKVRDTTTGVSGVTQALGPRSRQLQAVLTLIGRYWKEQARSSASSPGPQSPIPEPPSAPSSPSSSTSASSPI